MSAYRVQNIIMRTHHNTLVLILIVLLSYTVKVDLSLQTNLYVISNGVPALPKEFSQLAALGFGELNDIQWDCGGVLVHPKFVLTAAHCLYSRRLESDVKYVRLGDIDLFAEVGDTESQQLEIHKLHKHPDYTPSLYYHDIALLELKAPVAITPFVNYVSLDQISELEANDNHTGVVAGWGKISFLGPKSDYLQKAVVTIYESTACKTIIDENRTRKLKKGFDEITQICAIGTEGRDTCVGDSGGPLYKLHKGNGRYQFVGITSAGIGCGGSIPGLYTNVAHYLPWIKNITAANS